MELPMKTKSLFAGFVALALLALSAALSGCATRDARVQAQLHPAQFLQDAGSVHDWAGGLDDSQAAVAASWRR